MKKGVRGCLIKNMRIVVFRMFPFGNINFIKSK